jgi:putative redox protein
MSQITAELDHGMTVRLSNGRHNWQADEPVAAGGSDSGPNPYELLLSALASCTCLTLAMYCRHKGLVLHSIQAVYEFSNVHADDCQDCEETDKGLIQKITSRVQINGEFDAAQKKRLAQIVERCPVHKTLAAGVRISDTTSFA